MACDIGDKAIYKNKDGECTKGTIVDIWRFVSNEITDYLLKLDSGLTGTHKADFRGQRYLSKLILKGKGHHFERT